jgi:exopolysaccharide production protein ExoQ
VQSTTSPPTNAAPTASLTPSGFKPGFKQPGLTIKDLIRGGEILLFILGVMFFSGGLGVGAEEGDLMPSLLPKTVLSAARYLIWGLTSLSLLVNWRSAGVRSRRNWAMWALTAIVLLSELWSINPTVTREANREVLQMLCFGLFVATRFSIVEQVRLLAFCFGSGALLSLGVAAIVPTAGRHVLHHIGAFKGIYDYKNTLGSMMVMGMVSFSLLTVRSLWGKLYRVAGFILCFVLMLLSTSKTSLLLTFGILALISFYRNFRWRGRQTIIFLDFAILAVACGGYFIIENWVTLVSGLGKDPTMSGRTKIWGSMLTDIWRSPWLGFGRATFWNKPSEYATRAGEAVSFRYIPPHGHNGYLDLLVDVGFVGIGLFLIAFAITYYRSLRLAYAAERSENYWPIAFLTFLAMNNWTESYLMRLVNLYWPLFLAVGWSLPATAVWRQSNAAINSPTTSPAQPFN